MKIEAVLFDLDNTLILFDENKFFHTYATKLSEYFRDVLSTQEFVGRLVASTQVMTNNDGKLNNADYFMIDFSTGLTIDKNETWLRFEKFYEKEFIQFGSFMKPLKNTRDLIKKIANKGLKIVIASNPMFPENVQLMRLKWAGLGGLDFERITHATNSTYCKPNINYYSEICRKINVKPENCLMVGNDDFNDMIAANIGMKTFLTNDGQHHGVDVSRELAKDNKLDMPEPDYRGKLSEVVSILDI